MLRSLFILLSLISAGFAASESKKPTPARRLEVYTAGIMPGPGADKRSITVIDDTFILSVDAAKQEPDGSVWWGSVTEKRLMLTPERAKKFWAQIEQLRLFEWRDSYSPGDVGAIVSDGMSWAV